ncbi:unnamed protein product [Heligmosomoides polygyrus]|uniref:Ribosomal RNA-processing protein 42 n=1 Tax=Heligmosomoides polygyrus TaxID=6339 RepID=A0A183GGB1_HELPZ|nr:unnamed protein product [Heligmosomoides polygyrus]
MELILLGIAEKHFIVQGFVDGCRNDGRGVEDFRPMWIESPALSTTNGSARVKIDTTDILVGVKCEVVECEDTASVPNRLQFTVDPSLILSKQFMWKVYVDVVIQQYGGNIVDAIFIAVKAALLDTRITVLTLVPQDEGKFNIECDESTETNYFRLEAANAPLCISVNQIGKSIAVDCTEVEEALLRTALWIVMDQPESDRTSDDQIRLRLVKQMDPGGMDPRSISGMIDMAIRVGRNLHSSVNSRLEEIRKGDGAHIPGYSFLHE